MKRLNLLLLLLIPSFCFSQNNIHHDDFQMDQLINHNCLSDDTYLLDSIVRRGLQPNDSATSKKEYEYYPDGNLKTYIYYCYICNERMTAEKYEYEYDGEGRKNLLIESIAGADLDWIPNQKIISTWFDDDYISDRVYYSYNGTKWIPQTRSLSPDLGQPDKFTTIHFKWDITNNEWDTTSKSFSYLNEENKVTDIYTYKKKQGVWQITALVTKEYSPTGDILFERRYGSGDNGDSYDFIKLYEYEYNSDYHLTDLWERWDGWDIWYHDRWMYDEYGRLWRQYYFKKTPVHPESQGGIIFKYYYNDLNLIHHRNVFSSYSETHYANDFYYYSLFPVNTENLAMNQFPLKSYPNPFAKSTTIEYELHQPANVKISIYNQLGELVDVIQETQSPGKQQVVWNANGLPSGMYYFTIQIGDEIANEKMVVAR